MTFYSLPEFSPVYETTRVKNCTWVGGVDLNDNANEDGAAEATGVTILLSLNRRIQVVRIGQDARVIRNIDFAGSTTCLRRDSFACVADSRSYALIDVERQLKIPLMPISSLDNPQLGGETLGQAQNIAGGGNGGGLSRRASTTNSRPTSELFEDSTHARSASLGGLMAGSLRRPESRQIDVDEAVLQDSSTPVRSNTPVPATTDSTDKTLAPAPGVQSHAAGGHQQQQQQQQQPPRSNTPISIATVLLKPQIASPTPDEFLIVTGTQPSDAGIGMFVNLDGDPTRPTVEFDTYPKQIAIDGGGADPEASKSSLGGAEEGYVLASLEREFDDSVHHGLEIQRWDINMGEQGVTKYWLECPPSNSEAKKGGSGATRSGPIGIRSVIGHEETCLVEVTRRLSKMRFHVFAPGSLETTPFSLKSQDSRTATSLERLRKEKELFERDLDSSQDEECLSESWEATRIAEEEEYAKKFSGAVGRLAVWSGNTVWWAMRNPLLLQMEAGLNSTIASSSSLLLDRKKLFKVLGCIQDRVERTELEFYTFSYIRQRAGLILFTSFLHSESKPFSASEMNGMETLLIESQVDPRIILSLVPALRNEIIEGKKGIWAYGGIIATLQHYIGSVSSGKVPDNVHAMKTDVLYFLKRFLGVWRKKKGYGSVGDEREIFRSVDAALLGVLLEIDRHSPNGLGRVGSVRADLYELADYGLDCFDRAVSLLESYNRLYVLSRLYQSRKMAGDVLATWKRIMEGEPDEGGEFAVAEGEQKMAGYLSRIGSRELVQEYGVYLANRNPKLGVKVFADDKARVRFEPSQVVSVLRAYAPEAVRYYLEYLVFGKGHTQYVDELVGYYLDVVLQSLRDSDEKREMVKESYETYRALRPPKPTYRQFLADNSPEKGQDGQEEDETWKARLRLLKLLGGDHAYNVAAIRAKIEALSPSIGTGEVVAGEGGNEEKEEEEEEENILLVPETIILDGRERRHAHAIRLLVHRLGDYDTAVNYCLRGGASLYTSSKYSVDANIAPGSHPAATSCSSSSPTSSNKKLTTTTKRKPSMPPTPTVQTYLFRLLLDEFLAIMDVSDRVEQTSLLLDRFGTTFYNVEDILELVPDEWAADTVAGFLARAMRKLVSERRESEVGRCLAGTENLDLAVEVLMGIERGGPRWEG